MLNQIFRKFPEDVRGRILVSSLAVVGLMALGSPAQAGDSTVCASGCGFTTIQAAVDDAGTVDGDTITLLAESYSSFILDKRLTIKGVQAGVNACSRTGAGDESKIDSGATTLIQLKGGSAGAVIDGLHLSGGTKGIESTSGPIDNLKILNTLIDGFTGTGVFLNDNGVDITAAQNRIDGSSQAGSGGLFHLDTDNFDGFHFVDNCIVNGTQGVGFFVDGNRNVGVSTTRAPQFTGNLFDSMAANSGANVGTRAIEFATIEHNTFSNNAYDGLQGGIKGSLISQNSFSNNGRAGLRLTGFGSNDPTKGAQSNTIKNNCFLDNGLVMAGGAGIRFDAQNAAGSQATHTIRDNNFVGNTPGALNNSADAVIAENNWWGAANGPSGDGTGSGDDVVGTTGGGSIDFDPFLTAEQPNTPCSSTTVNLDHYQCYDAKSQPHFGGALVSLEDQFGLINGVEVKKTKTLCAPVSKNGEPVTNSDTHLVCYDVKKAADLKKRRVKITNQFGEQILELKRAERLCVPSTKELLPYLEKDHDGHHDHDD